MRWNDWIVLISSIVAALAAIIIPIVIYLKQKRDRQRELEYELDAMNHVSSFPMTMKEREFYTRKGTLESMLKK